MTAHPSSAVWRDANNHWYAEITLYVNEECSEQVRIQRTFLYEEVAMAWRAAIMELLVNDSIEIVKESR